MKTLIASAVACMPLVTFALVDYTPQSNTPKAKPATKSKKTTSNKKSVSSLAQFSISSEIEQTQYLSDEFEKLDTVALKGFFATQYGLFLEARMKGSQIQDSEKYDSYYAHNPQLKLGLNWMNWGSRSNLGQLNLATRFYMPISNSPVAADRTDITLGVESFKDFGPFGLGLSYHHWFLGSDDKLEAAGLDMVEEINLEIETNLAPNIKLAADARLYLLGKSNDQIKDSSLANAGVSLSMMLNRSWMMKIRTTIPLKRGEDSNIVSSNDLWSLEGINSRQYSLMLEYAL